MYHTRLKKHTHTVKEKKGILQFRVNFSSIYRHFSYVTLATLQTLISCIYKSPVYTVWEQVMSTWYRAGFCGCLCFSDVQVSGPSVNLVYSHI